MGRKKNERKRLLGRDEGKEREKSKEMTEGEEEPCRVEGGERGGAERESERARNCPKTALYILRQL